MERPARRLTGADVVLHCVAPVIMDIPSALLLPSPPLTTNIRLEVKGLRPSADASR